MHVELKNAPEIRNLLRNAQGEYNQVRASLILFRGPMDLDSNWSGGSKTWWTLVSLSDGRVLPLPESGGLNQPKAPTLEALQPNTVLVECCVFQGKPVPARIHMHQENLTKLLPATVELSEQEKSVLRITSSIKSSYRADEFYRAGLSTQTVNEIKVQLQAKGLLDKRGAITVAGRNAIS